MTNFDDKPYVDPGGHVDWEKRANMTSDEPDITPPKNFKSPKSGYLSNKINKFIRQKNEGPSGGKYYSEEDKRYLSSGEKPPKGAKVNTGPRGGRFYSDKLPKEDNENSLVQVCANCGTKIFTPYSIARCPKCGKPWEGSRWSNKVSKSPVQYGNKFYLEPGEDPPKGVTVHTGPKGGKYYFGKVPSFKEKEETKKVSISERKKRAQELREEAERHQESRRRSEDSSDTDGFLSQWASNLASEKAIHQAEIEENNGKWAFPALFDLKGNRVRAKLIRSWDRFTKRHKSVWAICDENDKFTGEFINAFPSRESTLAKRGYKEGKEDAPAEAKIQGSGHGLSGNAWAAKVRTDKGYPDNAKVKLGTVSKLTRLFPQKSYELSELTDDQKKELKGKPAKKFTDREGEITHYKVTLNDSRIITIFND